MLRWQIASCWSPEACAVLKVFCGLPCLYHCHSLGRGCCSSSCRQQILMGTAWESVPCASGLVNDWIFLPSFHIRTAWDLARMPGPRQNPFGGRTGKGDPQFCPTWVPSLPTAHGRPPVAVAPAGTTVSGITSPRCGTSPARLLRVVQKLSLIDWSRDEVVVFPKVCLMPKNGDFFGVVFFCVFFGWPPFSFTVRKTAMKFPSSKNPAFRHPLGFHDCEHFTVQASQRFDQEAEKNTRFVAPGSVGLVSFVWGIDDLGARCKIALLASWLWHWRHLELFQCETWSFCGNAPQLWQQWRTGWFDKLVKGRSESLTAGLLPIAMTFWCTKITK